MKTTESYEKFLTIIKKLRAPDGCPWDREQTPLSMRKDLLEEVYEAIDAINEADNEHIKEELGDVLLNVTLISYMYEQNGDFSIADVLDTLSEKLIRRHPHVFPTSKGQENALKNVTTSDDVLSQWDAIKNGIEGRTGKTSILDEISPGLTPLMQAYKMQKKVAKKGFDWPDAKGPRLKVIEEIFELYDASLHKEKLPSGETCSAPILSAIEDEAGDLLFATINWLRHLDIDPSVALLRANKKFKDRFMYVEQMSAKKGITMCAENRDKMEALWNDAKNKKDRPQ